MKRLFKDKRGMTLTEMLVALTLLMIVVVGTTPVMLSSYDGLYQAGEKTQSTYEAKSEIEDTLATRNSVDIVENFKVNFAGLGQVFAIKGKRAVSSLEHTLETVFTGGRAYVTIVSSKVINDDKLSHDVTLQTTNITFESEDDISFNSPDRVTSGTKSIDVSLYLPDKSPTNGSSLALIYKNRANTATEGIIVTKANHETGRIYVQVKGVSFTNSPAKIEVTYLDETDRTIDGKPKVKKTSCYLTIKTPTIMAVGTTTYGDYYTSAGVETFKNPDGSTYNKLAVDARRMDISGTKSGYTKAIPRKSADGKIQDTVFKSVKWITEYNPNASSQGNNDDVEMVNTIYEPSYYVLTGTNGAIYRTYSFTGYNTTFVGKTNLSVSNDDVAAFKAKFHPLTSQTGQDVLGIEDSIYTLDDSKSTIVYPAVWGGDFTHIYGYSAYDTKANYKDQDTWYTQSTVNSGVGQPGYYSNFVNYAYWYSGYGTNFKYYTQNSKKISYILTELPYALRVGGFMNEAGDYDGGINRIWERPIVWKADGTYDSANQEKKTDDRFIAYYYKKAGEDLTRCTIVELSKNLGVWPFEKDNWIYDDNYLNEVPTYFDLYGTQDANQWGDEAFAQLRIKGLTTYSPKILHQERANDDDELSSFKWLYTPTTNEAKIAVTDAVYIPATSTTSGGVFYVGTVAAYATINQIDNCESSENYAAVIRNNGSDNRGWQTTYCVLGNDEGTATSVYKYSSSAIGRQSGNENIAQNKTNLTGTGVKANSDESREFYVTRNSGSESQQLFSDVYFTMGFTSNREMVYSKIVYGKDQNGVLKEAYKSYEPYYFLSHYDDVTDTHVPNVYMNDYASTKKPDVSDNGYGGNITGGYYNVMDNDYYNVWFPGEMYNLTKVVTKDGVSVSVGYAVSGSTYTWINPNQPTNASTALGSIYNDGVLAAMILGKDSSFTNLLYFKDQVGYRSDGIDDGFDDVSLADGTVSYFSGDKTYRKLLAGGDAGWKCGTHQRDSIQFTAVDISIESVKSGSSEVSTYYAYYADNKGRLYKSKIATKTSDSSGSTKSTPVMVSHISDKSYATNTAPAYMEQVMVNGQPVGNYFSKITTVSCDGDYILVSGHSADGNFNLVVGKIKYEIDKDGNPISSSVSWKLVKLGGYNYWQAEDILILDGYAYIAGVSVKNANLTQGFIYAVSLEEINSTVNNASLEYKPNLFVGDDNLKDCIYAIDGHKS